MKTLLALLGMLLCVAAALASLILGIMHNSTGFGALGALISLFSAFGCGFYAEHCASKGF